MMLGLVGEGSNQDLPEPGNQLPFPRTGELRKFSMRLQERFLDQVGGIELNLQRWADEGAGQEPEVIAVQLQEPAQRRFVAGAGILQQ